MSNHHCHRLVSVCPQAELDGRAERLQALQAAQKLSEQQLAAAAQQLDKQGRQHEVALAKLELRWQGAAKKAEQAAEEERERLQVGQQGGATCGRRGVEWPEGSQGGSTGGGGWAGADAWWL